MPRFLTSPGHALLGALLLVPVTGALALHSAGHFEIASARIDQENLHFEGEYGLWVSEAEGVTTVRWITRFAGAGFLRVLISDTLRYGFETPVSLVHEAAFSRLWPGPVTLQYGNGADEEDQHITVLSPLDPDGARIVEFDGVDSLFVIGDVHGEYDTLVQLLKNAGLVDENANWSAGTSHLVFLGDLFDRGADVTRTLWFLYGLERQAEAADGRIHVVLGNHEIMVMIDDLRYVSAKEKLIAQYYGTSYPRLFDVRYSVLGKWLASKPAMLRIDDVLLAHGGVGPDYANYTLEAFDDSLDSFINSDVFHRWSDSTVVVAPIDSVSLYRRIDFFFDEGSVFWHRGYVRSDTLGDVLRQVLERYGTDLHVVAHTPVETIQQRYDGSLIAVDLSDAATEILLLVRGDAGYQRLKYGLEGGPEPVAMGRAAVATSDTASSSR